MQTSLWQLQVAIYNRLSNDVALNNVITGVHDSVSATATKPYLVLGSPTVTPSATKTSYGENIVLTLDTWSSYSGRKETIYIFNLILAALKEPLTIGGSFLMLKRELVSMNILDDPVEDGIKHGVLELRFIINN